ncbi:hypothetical protein [Pseudomonas monteilii]|uniref:hypothetical protein n=1 Tax=Pseudomonas monteilii TaxID=76759 RepID=UPI001113002A|nr:hypothetical protein [Pseudomonas monteilii]
MTSFFNEVTDLLVSKGGHFAAFILKADAVDIRLLCKSFRRKCRVFAGSTDFQLAWVRVSDGLLLMISGAPVFSALLQSFLASGYFAESQLYKGPSRVLFEKRIGIALRGYVKNGMQRSYGGNRR